MWKGIEITHLLNLPSNSLADEFFDMAKVRADAFSKSERVSVFEQWISSWFPRYPTLSKQEKGDVKTFVQMLLEVERFGRSDARVQDYWKEIEQYGDEYRKVIEGWRSPNELINEHHELREYFHYVLFKDYLIARKKEGEVKMSKALKNSLNRVIKAVASGTASSRDKEYLKDLKKFYNKHKGREEWNVVRKEGTKAA